MMRGRGEAWRVLGIDPALLTFGHGCVSIREGVAESLGSGVFEAPATAAKVLGKRGRMVKGPKVSMGERIDAIVRHFVALLDRYDPHAVAAESFVFYGRGAGAATNVLRVCGALRAVCLLRRIEFAEYQAKWVKFELTADAKGDKAGVAAKCVELLRLTAAPATNHESDALGVALTHLRRTAKELVIVTRGGDTFGNSSRVVTKRESANPGGANAPAKKVAKQCKPSTELPKQPPNRAPRKPRASPGAA